MDPLENTKDLFAYGEARAIHQESRGCHIPDAWPHARRLRLCIEELLPMVLQMNSCRRYGSKNGLRRWLVRIHGKVSEIQGLNDIMTSTDYPGLDGRYHYDWTAIGGPLIDLSAIIEGAINALDNDRLEVRGNQALVRL